MKLFSVLMMLVVFCACGHEGMRADDLSGSYARQFKGVYAVGKDTLLLQKLNKATYRITKSSSFQRIMEGKKSADTQYQRQHWLATYDPPRQVLNIRPSGKVLGVDVGKQQITLTSAIYQRIQKK